MAKSAQKSSPEINIELMPGEEPSAAKGGFVHWVLTVGRYLIIFTEIVAIAIFILSIKFSTDKQSLKRDISSLTQQVQAQNEFESKFRFVQNRINEIHTQRNNHFENHKVVAEFLALLPKGMSLKTLEIADEVVKFSGEFSTPTQLQTLISSFSDSKKLVALDISELNSPTEQNKNFTFTASAIINKAAFEQKE